MPRALVAAVALALTGCSTPQPTETATHPPAATSSAAPISISSAVPTPPPTSAPATPATPSAGAIASLVLSGLGSGGSSATHAIGVCGSTSAGFAVQLGFAPGGQPYILTIELFDHHGAGPYVIPPERVSVREAGTAGGAQIYPATTGTVTIDPGERTGTIDVSLAMPTGAARLSGQWAC